LVPRSFLSVKITKAPADGNLSLFQLNLGSHVPEMACSASLRPLRYILDAAFDAPLGAAAIGGADCGNGSPLRRETIQATELGMC